MSRRPRPEGPEGMLWCSRGKHFAPVAQFSVKKKQPEHKRVYYHAWCKACSVDYLKETRNA
jgi:hypothetical protein